MKHKIIDMKPLTRSEDANQYRFYEDAVFVGNVPQGKRVFISGGPNPEDSFIVADVIMVSGSYFSGIAGTLPSRPEDNIGRPVETSYTPRAHQDVTDCVRKDGTLVVQLYQWHGRPHGNSELWVHIADDPLAEP